MRILLAILIPPLAVLLCGRLFLAMIFAVLWVVSLAGIVAAGVGLIGWAILSLAAVYVVVKHDADKRTKTLTRAFMAGQQR